MASENDRERRVVLAIQCVVCNGRGCNCMCEWCGEFYCDDHLSLAAKRHANCKGDDLKKKLKLMAAQNESKERRILPFECVVCNCKGCENVCEICGDFYCDEDISHAMRRHENGDVSERHGFKKLNVFD